MVVFFELNKFIVLKSIKFRKNVLISIILREGEFNYYAGDKIDLQEANELMMAMKFFDRSYSK